MRKPATAVQPKNRDLAHYLLKHPQKLFCKKKVNKKILVQRPGIEPGPPAWQARILPLNQRCLLVKPYSKIKVGSDVVWQKFFQVVTHNT